MLNAAGQQLAEMIVAALGHASFVALVGPSRSGKTMIARQMGGSYVLPFMGLSRVVASASATRP
jgi:hypothetical protein